MSSEDPTLAVSAAESMIGGQPQGLGDLSLKSLANALVDLALQLSQDQGDRESTREAKAA